MKKRIHYHLSMLLICIGSISLVWSLYSYSIGFFASEEQQVHLNDFSDNSKAAMKKKVELYQDIPKLGEEMGLLTIPKLEISLPFYQGTSEKVLKKGVGHYYESALPGEKNNVVLSGHRDTVFRRLGDLNERDTLIVSNEVGKFLYKIKKIRIVDADDRTVVVPKPRATLTVTTCYPFNYIGDAPQRYVLVAELVNSELKSNNLKEGHLASN